MKKFPVVSANGNEYLVDLERYTNIISEETLEVRLYKKSERNFLGFKSERVIHVYSNFYKKDDLYRYVEAIEDTVKDYELKIKKDAERDAKDKKAQEENLKTFEDWDGVCK